MLDVTLQKGKESGQSVDRDDIVRRIREVFEEQRAHRWELAQTTASERIAKLGRLRDVIHRRRDELRAAMYEDFRKPAAEVDISELQPVLFEITHTMKHLRSWMKPVPVSAPPTLIGTQSMIRCEPKGCVLVLSPWNYPFNLMMCPVIAAIAAGNAVMARPSDKVPRTARFMASLVEEVFPRHEVALFTGPNWIANTMLELPFDHVMFTGSTRIGKQVMEAASRNLASVTLELGGQSPVVVDETADVEAAARRIVWGKYLNGGQTCIAPNHVFVHESVMVPFVEAARRAIEHSYGQTEEARKKSEDFCRIVDVPTARKLAETIDRTVASGARIEIGGVSETDERYIAPTILSGVKDDSPIMESEIFGPIMPLLPYRTLDEVFASIRRRGKPLAMYVFSNDRGTIDRLIAGTSAGGTVVNNVLLHFANQDLPFGGVGDSGMGHYHGIHGFKEFSHERAVMVQQLPALVRLFYPPYIPRVRRGIELITKLLG